MSKSIDIDRILVKAITDFNIRDMGGMNDGRNARLSIKEAKQAIYSLLASEAVEYEKWVGENQATGHAIKVKALPLLVLREVFGIKE